MQELHELIADAYANPSGGRIITIMGQNGVGKTRLLNGAFAHFAQHSRINITSDRSYNAGFSPSNYSPAIRSFEDIFDSVIAGPNPHSRSVPGMGPVAVFNSVFQLYQSLENSDRIAINAYKDELFAWSKHRTGEAPLNAPSGVEQLDNYLGDILSHEFRFESDGTTPGPRLKVKHPSNSDWAAVDTLSAGERQILGLSGLLFKSIERQAIFFIDEPELHLNESRAVDVWEKIEARFPKAVFVYATHSAVFSTRPSVDLMFVMSPDGLKKVDRATGLDAGDLRAIVGGRTRLRLKEGKIIFVEDDLLKDVVRDLLSDEDVEIVPLGGCERVRAAMQSEDWKLGVFFGDGPKVGVIDRDEWTDAKIDEFDQKRIVCFPYYEAESVLLVPEIFKELSKAALGNPLPDNSFEAAIIEAANKTIDKSLSNLAKHIATQSPHKIEFRRDGYSIKDLRETSPNSSQKFQARAQDLLLALKEKDVLEILRLFDGKILYQQFRATLKTVSQMELPSATQRYNESRLNEGFMRAVKADPLISEFVGRLHRHLREDAI